MQIGGDFVGTVFFLRSSVEVEIHELELYGFYLPFFHMSRPGIPAGNGAELWIFKPAFSAAEKQV